MIETRPNEEEIFKAAHEISSPHARGAYLRQVCGDDEALHKRVLALLHVVEQEQSFLERPAAAPLETAPTSPVRQKPGEPIGPYKLLEQIGEGGMGVVFMAQQTAPVKRKVALKVIKPGMDSKQVIARFEAERQALALMDHQHIARVLDAGTTEGGRPYFVMELVRGVPISEYCDKHRLNTRERLKLYLDVCQAVQHAHLKGIIHRDLKPSNVLVTLHDGVPVVKVIDFGVAKALNQELTEKTLFTQFSQMVGTPLYMSPEQAEVSGLDIDTRTDVYSLGVLLYELLTGTTPFDKDRLKNAGFDEMRRIIREDEPPKPSTRISTVRAVGESTTSGKRGSDPRHLSRLLRGELDWIVMKALEKDRSRRYESASALAADIQRYLSDEPVLACPPTAMYRFQKFAGKYKPALFTAAAIALCLLLGTTVSAWQAVRATTAEAQANANATQAQVKEQEAIKQRDEIKVVNEKLEATQAALRRTLYAAHMNLARHAWEAGIVDQAEELLAQHRPKLGETDLRGFEWYYLNRLCHGEMLALRGHAKEVLSIAYSPDGKRVATGSLDSTVKVWDALTGREILTFKGHEHEVNTVAFSPDGKHVASGGGEWTKGAKGELKIWDARTGDEVYSLKGHLRGVSSALYSPDGKRLASGDWAGTIKTWDAQTGEELSSYKAHVSVDSIAFSADGKRLASSGGDVKIWDVETGKELLKKEDDSSGMLSFSPDGKRLAMNWEVIDAETGKRIHEFDLFNARGLVYSPDGRHLAGASGDKIVRIFDAETGRELFSLKGYSGRNVGYGIAYSPDSQRLALAGKDGTVKIWDATTGPEARILKGQKDNSSDVAYSPDGSRVAAAFFGGPVKVWNTETGEEILTIQRPAGGRGGGRGVEFSPDGKRLLSGGKVLDARTGQEISTAMPIKAYSPDGKLVASDGKVLDAHTGVELFSVGEHAGGRNMIFSPDGKTLASSSGPSTRFAEIKLWDTQTGRELHTLQELEGGVMGLTFSPDSKLFASTSYGGAVRLWDVQTGRELRNLKGHIAQVNSAAFSPDGKRLATRSLYHTVKVWDVQTGADLLTLKTGFGRGIAFSPDGHHLAGSGDLGVKLWDATPLPEKR